MSLVYRSLRRIVRPPVESVDCPPLERRVFTLWMGDNPISQRRLECLKSVEATGCKLTFVDQSSLEQWLLPGEPLHPAFEYLSAIHKGDYFRTYLMHFHGGGYTDIKYTSASWLPAFDFLDRRTDLVAMGYPAVGSYDVASDIRPKLWRYFLMFEYRWLIGNAAYIVRPQTEFTHRWWSELNRRLDRLLPLLKVNPAIHPRDRAGREFGGKMSSYPVPWSYILGSVFQPLVYKYRHRVSNLLPMPSLVDYK